MHPPDEPVTLDNPLPNSGHAAPEQADQVINAAGHDSPDDGDENEGTQALLRDDDGSEPVLARTGHESDHESDRESGQGTDQESGSVEQELAPPTPVEPRTARLSRVGMLVAALVVVAGRFAFAYDRVIYQLAPDEPGALAMSRFLSGGVHFTMFDFNTWRPGMAVLLAPVNMFTDDPVQLMHGAFLINSVLAAIATIQLARLAVRLTTLPTWACLFASVAIALSASSLSASAHVWAESLVTVSTLWLIAALIRFFDQPRLGPALSAATAVAVGVVSHGRLLPMLPVMATLVAFGFLRQRRFDRLWIWAAYTAVTSFGAIAFTNWVFANVWEETGGTNTIGTVVNNLGDGPGIGRSAVGQLWYQLVATFGIFGVGLLILCWHALWRRSTLPLARDSRVVLCVVLPLMFTSIAFMAGRDRTDHRIYGRYNDAVVWAILIVGIGWLASRIPWTRRLAMWVVIAASTVGAGALVAVLDGAAMAKSVGVRPMIAGFLPIVGASGNLNPWLLTAAGVGGSVIVFWALSKRYLVYFTVALTVVYVAAGGYRTHYALATNLNSWAKAGAVVEIDEIVPVDAPLAFRFVPDDKKPAASWLEQRRRSLLYQVYLPDHRFERDQGIDDGGSPYVFAPLNDPEMTKAEAILVWTDPGLKIGLWVEPGAPYTPLNNAVTAGAASDSNSTRPRT